jgi:hypothetical protein
MAASRKETAAAALLEFQLFLGDFPLHSLCFYTYDYV